MFDDAVGILGWPRHFQKLLGRKALAMVNDPLHKQIRTLNSRAFGDKQLDSYLPKLQKLSAKYLEDWVGKASSDLHPEAGGVQMSWILYDFVVFFQRIGRPLVLMTS